MEPCCFEMAFAKQWLAFTDIWDDNIFFFSQVLLEVRIVILNLRCYLLVVLCLMSPDFATCCLELHEHVVSDVIKRLNTFASVALSTLEPMFFHWAKLLWPRTWAEGIFWGYIIIFKSVCPNTGSFINQRIRLPVMKNIIDTCASKCYNNTVSNSFRRRSGLTEVSRFWPKSGVALAGTIDRPLRCHMLYLLC